jgi:hypothetical protein
MGRALATTLATAALAGCVSHGSAPPPEPTTIQVRDRSVFQPGVRISTNFVRGPSAPADAQGGHGIELGAMRSRGDGTQSVGSGAEPVVFGDRTFSPPQELRHEFEFAFFDLSYRWRRYFGADRAIGIETLAGVGVAALDFTVSSATQSTREALDSSGVLGGFGLIWRMRPGTTLQSRLSLYISGDGDGIANAARLDLFVAQALGRNVALRAGYSAWHLETDRGFRDSNINIKFAGPALGLDLAF